MTVDVGRTDLHKRILYSAAALSLIAALIHLWVIPEHFEEWWGYGTFFLVAAVAQGFYGAALLRWPTQPLLLLGIVGNSLIILLYLLTRTVGIPLLGPAAGEVEQLRFIDVCATTSEVALILALSSLLLWRLFHDRVNLFMFVLATAILLLAHLPHLLLASRLP